MSEQNRRPLDLLLPASAHESDTVTLGEIVLRDLESGEGQPSYRAWLHRSVDRMFAA